MTRLPKENTLNKEHSEAILLCHTYLEYPTTKLFKKCKENYLNKMTGKICINEKEMVNEEKCMVFKKKNAN